MQEMWLDSTSRSAVLLEKKLSEKKEQEVGGNN